MYFKFIVFKIFVIIKTEFYKISGKLKKNQSNFYSRNKTLVV